MNTRVQTTTTCPCCLRDTVLFLGFEEAANLFHRGKTPQEALVTKNRFIIETFRSGWCFECQEIIFQTSMPENEDDAVYFCDPEETPLSMETMLCIGF